MKIVVVIPVHNEHHTLESLSDGIVSQLSAHDYRILFIDDGSTDTSFRTMMELRKRNDRIDVIKFRRNFGKTQALSVAFHEIDADVVVTMDADLQDDPEELPHLLAKLDEGFDLVVGWKEKRHDPIHKTLPSKVYNGTINNVFDIDIHDVNTGFKVMRGEVARSLTLVADFHRLIPVMAAQQGYRIGEIPVRHHPRRFGKSKYGLSRFYEGVRDAGRLWFGARSESYAWIKVERWQLAMALAGDLALLGVALWVGMLESVVGPGMVIIGVLAVVLSGCLVVVGNLSRAVDTSIADESTLDCIAEDHRGAVSEAVCS